MKDAILAVLFLLALFVLLRVAILWLRDKIFYSSRKRTPEQVQAGWEAYRERLLHPQQTNVEAELGGLLPQRLIALYADRELILGQKIGICPPGKDPKNSTEWIDNFLPLDWEGQKHTCDLELLAKAKGFCFARDGFGKFLLGACQRHPTARCSSFFRLPRSLGNEKVADSLDEFLAWPHIFHARVLEVKS